MVFEERKVDGEKVSAPGEKPVRLKGRKVEKAEETNKEEKEPRREKELRGTAPYMVANEATDAQSDNG